MILSTFHSKSGCIWFGTNGGGFCKFEGSFFTTYTKNEGLNNASINCVLEDKDKNIWLGTDEGAIKFDGKHFTTFTNNKGLGSTVFSILEDKSGNIWFGTYGGAIKYDKKSFTTFDKKEGLGFNLVRNILEDKNGDIWFAGGEGNGVSVTKYDGIRFTQFSKKEGFTNSTIFNLIEDKKGKLWFGSANDGVYVYDGKYFTQLSENEGLISNSVASILQDKDENIWIGTRLGLSKLSSKMYSILNEIAQKKVIKESKSLFKNYIYDDGFTGIGVNIGTSMIEDPDNTIWLGTNDRLMAYHKEGNLIDTIPPNIQLTNISLFNENVSWKNLYTKKDSVLTLGNGVKLKSIQFDGLSKWYSLPENLSLAYNNNYLTFSFIGITMSQSKKVKYQYKLEGIDDNWSALTTRSDAPYGNLPHGTFTFKVKAMNSEGYWSNEFNYAFSIRPPFWHTWWFRILVGLIIISSIVFYVKWRERTLKERQRVLEYEIVVATLDIKEQKEIIEEKHKEITDSINYAERIQRSFLATKELLDDNLHNYFVLFKPKDVVSGDFYWADKLSNGNFALVTADSTGHGVPGAIMSLLNITSIEGAIKDGLTEPAGILNATRKSIINRLKKDGSVEGGKDGMDASIVCFDFKNNNLIIAAANNPVWIIRGSEIIEIKPDKMPVGKHDRQDVSFTQQEIELVPGDVVYTLTDGYPDQFGGEKGKKFMSKKLRELLMANAHLPMQVQKELLETTFANWVGNLEQVDDVTLIGVRV